MKIAHNVSLVERIGQRDACRIVARFCFGESDALGKTNEQLCCQFWCEWIDRRFLGDHRHRGWCRHIGHFGCCFTEFVDYAHCRLPHITVVSATNALHTVDGAVVLPDEAVVYIDSPTWGKVETHCHITAQTNGERVVHFGSHNFACFTMHHLCRVAAQVGTRTQPKFHGLFFIYRCKEKASEIEVSIHRGLPERDVTLDLRERRSRKLHLLWVVALFANQRFALFVCHRKMIDGSVNHCVGIVGVGIVLSQVEIALEVVGESTAFSSTKSRLESKYRRELITPTELCTQPQV